MLDADEHSSGQKRNQAALNSTTKFNLLKKAGECGDKLKRLSHADFRPLSAPEPRLLSPAPDNSSRVHCMC
jgi:hypothetical protein